MVDRTVENTWEEGWAMAFIRVRPLPPLGERAMTDDLAHCQRIQLEQLCASVAE